MSHKINFADNIFLLTMKIKTLKHILKLDIDGDLFQKRINEEIHFIAATSDEIYNLLKESQFIIDRAENLKNLQRLKFQFCQLLSAILDGTSSFSFSMEEYLEEYRIIRNDFMQDVGEIKAIIMGISEKTTEEKYIISEEEYRSLLAQED